MRSLRVWMLITLLLLGLNHIEAEATDINTLSASLREAVTQAGLRQHLEAFQVIADANGGNRSAGSAGYDASVAYVQGQLEAAGYEVSLQSFELDTFEVLAPAKLEQTSGVARSFTDGADMTTMNLSVSGEVKAKVQAVDVQLPPGPTDSSTSGCEASDFGEFTPGNIALLQRGTCTFHVKVTKATAAGASAVIIFNEGQTGRTEVFGGSLRAISSIPVLSASFELGQVLVASAPELRLKTETLAETRLTNNLIAESRSGDPDHVIMLGGHLDSVPNGPGINDNGSGSAAILEIALQLAELYDINSERASPLEHKLRFAWWGGEELGLLGSSHYVANLSPAELEHLRAYLNLDMIASPNFGRFAYDGDESDRMTDLPLPEGTVEIEEIFLDYFQDQAVSTAPVAVFSRSDHAPFARAGVAVGGLFTGAEDIKDRQGLKLFGGSAGKAYDACYHQTCDTIANVNTEVIEQMADATAHALATLALSLMPRVGVAPGNEP